MSDDHDDTPDTPDTPDRTALREATEEEDDLIHRLSVGVSHRLLRDWEDLPSEAKALPMNRAFLSALALSLANLLAATAVNDPENLEGWNFLVAQTLQIVRETAVEKRVVILEPAASQAVVARRVLIPEPKTVM